MRRTPFSKISGFISHNWLVFEQSLYAFLRMQNCISKNGTEAAMPKTRMDGVAKTAEPFLLL
jgi:hypothetical protein